MSNGECCKSCVEIIKCAEQAADFAENIAKSAKDIVMTSESMAKDAKGVVHICEYGHDGYFSSVKGFFGNIAKSVPNITENVLDNSKTDSNSVPETVHVNMQQVVNSQKSLPTKVYSPPENESISSLGTKTFTEPISEEIIKSAPEKLSSEKGVISSIGSILSTNNKNSDSITDVNEMVTNAGNTKEVSSQSADSLVSLMKTLVKTKDAVSDMKDCCSKSTAKFNTLLDEAYFEAELLKDGINKTHNLIPSSKLTSEYNYNQRISSKFSKLKDIIQEKSKHIGNNLQSRETTFFVCGVSIGIGTGYLIGVALGSKIVKNATKGLTNTEE